MKTINKPWWLKKDCRKCVAYPDCGFIETKLNKPRGCNLYYEKASLPVEAQGVKK